MRTLIIATLCAGLALAAGHATPLQAQATAAPRFEVASVKLSDPNAGAGSLIGPIPVILPPVGGRFSATNVPLRLLVRSAWGLPDFRIVGGPSWQLSQRFDISAKIEDGFSGTIAEVFPMLKTLLEDRFKLKTHMETRDLPTYSLVVSREDGRLGPKLKPSQSKCDEGAAAEAQKRVENALKAGPAGLATLIPKPGESPTCSLTPGPATLGAINLKGDGQRIQVLLSLVMEITGRVVNDKTGLTGLYDFDLTFDMLSLLNAAQGAGLNIPPGLLANLKSNAPALITALQEDLGLRLQSETGPVEVLVIDSAEMPTPD
jgi:uncharacterized protein (TIGR03435 family)